MKINVQLVLWSAFKPLLEVRDCEILKHHDTGVMITICEIYQDQLSCNASI